MILEQAESSTTLSPDDMSQSMMLAEVAETTCIPMRLRFCKDVMRCKAQQSHHRLSKLTEIMWLMLPTADVAHLRMSAVEVACLRAV